MTSTAALTAPFLNAGVCDLAARRVHGAAFPRRKLWPPLHGTCCPGGPCCCPRFKRSDLLDVYVYCILGIIVAVMVEFSANIIRENSGGAIVQLPGE